MIVCICEIIFFKRSSLEQIYCVVEREDRESRSMGLESVGDLAINAILRKLEAEDIARVACASKRFRSSASDDTLWINLCFNELALTQPIDNLGNPFPSFKVAPFFFLIFFHFS